MNTPEDEAFGLSLGAVDYIGKPFLASAVKICVQNQMKVIRQKSLVEDK